MADEKSKYSDLASKEKDAKHDSIVVDKDAVLKGLEEDPEYATSELRAAFLDMRQALKDGTVTDAGVRRVCANNGISEDAIFDFANMSRLEMEMNPYYKSDLTDVRGTYKAYDTNMNVEKLSKGDSVESAGVKLTRNGDHTVKCKSDYLGDFEYDDREYAVMFKSIDEDDGTKSYLPYLEYIGKDELGIQTENAIHDFASSTMSKSKKNWKKGGWWNKALSAGEWVVGGVSYVAAMPGDLINGVASGFDDNQTIGPDSCEIPDGVKVLDYTFAGHDQLQHFPKKIPSSVTSMHATFNGCSRMTVDSHFWADQKVVLPEGLEDMSLTFKNCSSLQAEFYENAEKHIPTGVVNTVECWNGCSSMSKESVSFNAERANRNFLISRPSHGFGDLSKVKYDLPNVDPCIYLSAALSRDMLAGIAGCTDNEKIKEYADGIEHAIDYSGRLTDKFEELAADVDVDAEKLEAAQTAATMYYQGDSHLGDIMSRAELASGGARSDNVYLDEDGKIRNDPTGLKNSLQIRDDAKANLWEYVAAYGGTFAAASAVTGSITKNKYAAILGGAASTFALSTAFPKLYSSMYPVLNFTRNLLPDGDLKDKYSEWISEHCASAEIVESNERIAKRNKEFDSDYNAASAIISGKRLNGEDISYTSGDTRHYTSPLTDIFDRASDMAVMWEASELDTLMENSSKSCADMEVFLALGTYRDPDTDMFKDCTSPVVESITTATNSMETYWKDARNEGTYADDTIRNDMRQYYKTMLHAISKYDDSAVDALCEKYTLGSRDYRLAKEGLAMVNKSYMDALTESMEEMESEFHFMDDDMKNAVKSVGLSGVTVSDIHNVKRTVPGTYIDDYVSFWEDFERDNKQFMKEDSKKSDKNTDNVEEQLGLSVSDSETNAETDTDVAAAY